MYMMSDAIYTKIFHRKNVKCYCKKNLVRLFSNKEQLIEKEFV